MDRVQINSSSYQPSQRIVRVGTKKKEKKEEKKKTSKKKTTDKKSTNKSSKEKSE